MRKIILFFVSILLSMNAYSNSFNNEIEEFKESVKKEIINDLQLQNCNDIFVNVVPFVSYALSSGNSGQSIIKEKLILNKYFAYIFVYRQNSLVKIIERHDKNFYVEILPINNSDINKFIFFVDHLKEYDDFAFFHFLTRNSMATKNIVICLKDSTISFITDSFKKYNSFESIVNDNYKSINELYEIQQSYKQPVYSYAPSDITEAIKECEKDYFHFLWLFPEDTLTAIHLFVKEFSSYVSIDLDTQNNLENIIYNRLKSKNVNDYEFKDPYSINFLQEDIFPTLNSIIEKEKINQYISLRKKQEVIYGRCKDFIYRSVTENRVLQYGELMEEYRKLLWQKK